MAMGGVARAVPQVSDQYKEAMKHAQGHDLECEAMAACQLGRLYTEVLKGQGEAMRRKGRGYFKVRAQGSSKKRRHVDSVAC